MQNQYIRTAMLIGEEGVGRLKNSRVAVFGVGGVGGFCVEALARSGVGSLDLIDNDTICESNLNRQIIAVRKTIGMAKVDAAEERIHDIDPDITVTKYRCFYLPENAGLFDFSVYDYVVDALDTVTAKIDIAMRAHEAGVPVISAMGAGNKMDPTRFYVTDLFDTKMDPLAKVLRRELRKRGIEHLKVVCSDEPAMTPLFSPAEEETDPENETVALSKAPRKRAVPGSIAFVPSAAGLIIAGEVIRDLVNNGSDGT